MMAVRTGMLVAALAAAAGCDSTPAEDQAVVPYPTNVAIDRIAASGARGRFVADRDGQKTAIDFALPADRIAPERAHFGTRLGETAAGVVVMLDQYASRPAAGRCEEGTETFVRIFSLAQRRQTAVVPVDSCRDGLEAEGEGARWLDGDRFEILGSPPRTYSVTEAGTISEDGKD